MYANTKDESLQGRFERDIAQLGTDICGLEREVAWGFYRLGATAAVGILNEEDRSDFIEDISAALNLAADTVERDKGPE